MSKSDSRNAGAGQTLAVVTITGDFSPEYDGLPLGMSRRTMVFRLTPAGLVRRGKLYKTFDTELLAERLGFTKWKVSTRLSEHETRRTLSQETA